MIQPFAYIINYSHLSVGKSKCVQCRTKKQKKKKKKKRRKNHRSDN